MAKIGIIGLGLIGASLGLDCRELGLEVWGIARRAETCSLALTRGMVDYASTDLSSLHSVDVVFIATPIASIVPTLEQLIPYLNPQTIVTDVGSVKAPIVNGCSRLWANFLGGHPMAGNAGQGLEAAVSHLFRGAPYVLTPTAQTPSRVLETLQAIAVALGSRVYCCTPEDHDQAVAWISHLPVMVSASLIGACGLESNPLVLELAQHLASSGFRDTSRVGGGNPDLGVMMAQYNRDCLLLSLGEYRHILDTVIEYIQQENWEALSQFLTHTQQSRPQFLA